MAKFFLRSRQSCEVFDGANLAAANCVAIYRIAVEHAHEAELKIISDGMQSKVISSAAPNKTIDICVRKNLFLEALGTNGVVVGSYELLTTDSVSRR
jgi:hypothetical protein